MNTIKKNGFTLIELLVSIMIIAVVSGIVMVNYGQGSKQNALARSAQKLAQDLRRAQNMATSTVAINGIISDYYGIYFTTAAPSSYIIFIDLSPFDQAYNVATEKIETNSLENSVQITGILDGVLPVAVKSLVFSSPFGSRPTGAQNITITLSITNPPAQKNVIIYPSGQIEIQ